jgi:hypothetical protein
MTKRIEHIEEDGVEKKWCGKCKSFKTLEIFGYSNSTWDNFRPTCKECLHEQNMANKEARTEYNREYWQRTMDVQKEKNKKWREENPERVKENMARWNELNADTRKERDKKYREENWDKIKERHNAWRRNNYQKLKTSPDLIDEFAEYKIKSNTSRRIRELLGNNKSQRCMEYVGCPLDKFRIHLETKFADGMHWKNYGINVNRTQQFVWHIDHIIPCNAFDLLNPVHQKACFHYKNTRPLWWDENIDKKDTFDPIRKEIYLQRFIETYIIP